MKPDDELASLLIQKNFSFTHNRLASLPLDWNFALLNLTTQLV